MARIPDQPLLKGTIGNLIYYSVGGRQYVRSRPVRVRQPNTPKQLLARDKFRQSSTLAKALSKAAPVLGLDETGNTTKSPYHTLLGFLRKSTFAEGRKPVRWVWEELVIRNGETPKLDMQCHYHPELKQLELHWESVPDSESTLLVVGIHSESLDVKVHHVSAQQVRVVLNVEHHNTWYFCVVKPGVEAKISASQFIGRI